MKYKDELKKMMEDDYRSFCKALFSIEKNIDDNEKLDRMYYYFMENDNINLIDDKIDEGV